MNDAKTKQLNFILKTVLLLLLVSVLAASALLATALLRYDTKTSQQDELHSIAIQGEYSEEGGPWTPLTSDTTFQNLDLRDITVRGHFTKDIPRGENLYLILDHMRVSLRVNGEDIYHLAPVKGDGNLTQAMGKQYVTIVSPGITTEDTVELNFGNLYRNAYIIQFDELLWQMHIGNERMMLFEAVRADGWTLSIGVLFFFLTLFLSLIAVCCGALRIKSALQFLWLGLTTFFTSLWFITLSPAPTLLFPRPVFLNVLYALSTQAIAICFVLFVIRNLSGWRRQLMKAVEGVLLLVLLVGLINQLLSIQDLYSAINYASVFDIAAIICVVICLWHEAFRMKIEESAALLKALLLLLLGGVLELINGYIQFSQASILLGIGLISFTVAEAVYLIYRIKRSIESEKRAVLLELELIESQTAVMLSQIQPHFLYNTLTAICGLCDENPQEAKRVTADFADYLRHNLDSLGKSTPVPFAGELEHIKVYLDIEKRRFEGDLRIVYDIEALDFMLPSLSVQPLVENAVKHGVGKAQNGGTVTITTKEYDDCYEVIVSDDGVGFNPDEEPDDGRPHVGIKNVEKRLWSMCGLTLDIKSEPGAGTTVVIRLPKGDDTP